MRNYQLVLVLKTSLVAAGRKKLVEAVKDFFKGAKFEKDVELGEKDLAYNIKKEGKGAFFSLKFEAENLPEGLDKKLKSNEDILRFLYLRV